MLRFIQTEKQVNILTEQEGIKLGYIDDKNVFFPNNNMMFRLSWMQEITRFMEITARQIQKDKGGKHGKNSTQMVG